MKIKLELHIKPFNVPNYVLASIPGQDDTTIPLKQVSADDLDKLCDDFRNAVFRNAGKQQPPEAACECDDR